jgi:hypothetical protein
VEVSRKTKTVEPVIPAHWTVKNEVQVNGRWLRPGSEFRIRGERGRMRFIKHVTHKHSGLSWVECWDKERHFRAFYVDRVATVHTRKMTRENNK